MRKQILITCLLLLSVCGFAQQITVKGIVTSDADKLGLIGATVQVKGTTNGTITGLDGDYTVPNVPKDAILVFSSIGYETQEIAVNGRTTINIVMKESSELLDEVVVIGYGAVKKSDLTSSIATVKAEDITQTVTGNAHGCLARQSKRCADIQWWWTGNYSESIDPWCYHCQRYRPALRSGRYAD